MSRIYRNVIPPGGWSFPQSGMPHPVTGATYDDLITNITNARIHNQMPLGNPAKDFEEWFCAIVPSFCDPNLEAVQPEREVDDPQKTFRERVQAFAGNRYQYAGSIELEDGDTANARARTCASCPQAQAWQDTCPCIENIQRNLTLLAQNRRTEPDLTGRGCRILGTDLNTACLLPAKYLYSASGKREEFSEEKKKQIEETPAFCWMRAI